MLTPYEAPYTATLPIDTLYKQAYDSSHSPDPHLKDPAIRTLNMFVANHTAYLEGQTKATELAASQLGLDVQPLHKGQAIAFDVDSQSTSLSPEELGLPQFQGKDSKILGLIIRRSVAGETSVQLLAIDKHSQPHLCYLESMSAGVNGQNHGVEDATWVEHGRARVATTEKVAVTKQVSKGLSTELIVPPPSDGSTYEVIRPQPTRYEQKLAFTHSPYDQERARRVNRAGKTVTRVAAVALGITSLFGLAAHQVQPTENPNNVAVRTVDDLVGSRDVKMIGNKPQVEALYDEATLGRAREALKAYMAGDMQALEAQRDKYGYKSNWADPEAVKALSEAKNFTELKERFARIVPTDGIFLSINTDDQYSSEDGDKMTTTDFADAKKAAEAAVSVLNAFDREVIKESRFGIVLSKNVKVDGEKVPGFMSLGVKKYMVVDVKSAGLKNTFGHEVTHYQDDKKSTSLTYQMLSLNPIGLPEAIYKEKKYVGLGVSDGGYKITVDEYGRKNAGEDAATVAGQWFDGKGAVQLDRSSAGEKTLGYLLWLDKQKPGAMAEFLRRAQPVVYAHPSPGDYALYGVEELGKDTLSIGLNIGFLAAAVIGVIGTSYKGYKLKKIASQGTSQTKS